MTDLSERPEPGTPDLPGFILQLRKLSVLTRAVYFCMLSIRQQMPDASSAMILAGVYSVFPDQDIEKLARCVERLAAHRLIKLRQEH